MKKYTFFATCAVVLTLTIGFFFGASTAKPEPVASSVAIANEYLSTTTDATFASTAKLLNTGSGVLGSVVVTTTGANTLTVYDATTTDVTKRTGGLATSTITIAKFQTVGTVGTFTFDVAYKNGLLVESGAGNQASSTITYR